MSKHLFHLRYPLLLHEVPAKSDHARQFSKVEQRPECGRLNNRQDLNKDWSKLLNPDTDG